MDDLENKSAFLIRDWKVEPRLNTLSREDVAHHVEPKVMKVLLVLAAQPNQVVSKDDLMKAVWTSTFVSDDVLTRCISLLRHLMGDDPRDPRFIQTIPKVGYRLVGEVRILPPKTAVEAPQNEPVAGHTAEEKMPSADAGFWRAKKSWVLAFAVGFLILLGVGGGVAWHMLGRPSRPAAYRTLQFTSYAGQQDRPAFSPDGKSLAFVWTEEDEGEPHIYIKKIGSETLARLTNLKESEYSPAWSPDGLEIAYLAETKDGLGIFIAEAKANGTQRKIFIPEEPTHWDQGDLSWSPDGKSLIFADHAGSSPSSTIYQLELSTLHARPLISPPSGWEGDLNPVYSPDGQSVAFLRASEMAVRDLYWVSAQGGQVHRLTQDGRNIDGLAWSADGKSLVFSSDRGGKYALWQIGLNGKGLERMPVGTEDATQPAVALSGGRLAYAQSSALWSIVRVLEGKGSESKPTAVLSSTQQDSAPSYSPDATQFAFQSWRSGNQEIWLSSADGHSLRQLTNFNGNLTGSPSWASRGDWIAFDSRVAGHSHVFVASVHGGPARQLTFGDANDIVPRWSANDQTLYFRSNRGGRWQLWKILVAGGIPQPVTSNDGMVSGESKDGKWLYFTRGYEAGLWRIPTAGGVETKVLDQPAAGYWGYWAITHKGIYYLDVQAGNAAISLYDPETRKVSRFARLDRMPPQNAGISVRAGDKELLITDLRNAESHITVAESLP